MRISSDDLNIVNANPKPVVEKIVGIQGVSSIHNLQTRGNYYPPGAATSAPVAEVQPKPDAEKIDQAVRSLNGHEQIVQRELHFSVDEDSGKTVIKVMDLSTKEVIRQIPNEEALSIASRLIEGVDMELFSEYI